MKFRSRVRGHKSIMGNFGKIVSKDLYAYVGKKVEVTIKEVKE